MVSGYRILSSKFEYYFREFKGSFEMKFKHYDYVHYLLRVAAREVKNLQKKTKNPENIKDLQKLPKIEGKTLKYIRFMIEIHNLTH